MNHARAHLNLVSIFSVLARCMVCIKRNHLTPYIIYIRNYSTFFYFSIFWPIFDPDQCGVGKHTRIACSWSVQQSLPPVQKQFTHCLSRPLKNACAYSASLDSKFSIFYSQNFRPEIEIACFLFRNRLSFYRQFLGSGTEISSFAESLIGGATQSAFFSVYTSHTSTRSSS